MTNFEFYYKVTFKIGEEPVIGDRKDGVCLQLHGLMSRQPKRCRSTMQKVEHYVAFQVLYIVNFWVTIVCAITGPFFPQVA